MHFRKKKNLIELKLEGKKKLCVPSSSSFFSSSSSSSSSSASSSFTSSPACSDAELENDEENKHVRQKVIEESDGNRPLAEDEKKPPRNLCSPRKTRIINEDQDQESNFVQKQEVVQSKTYVAGDAERKRLGKEILNQRQSFEDPLSDYVLGREVIDYAKLTLKTTLVDEEIEEKEVKLDNNNEEYRANLPVASTSYDVSKLSSTTNYQKKDDKNQLTTKLSNIRQSMKDFCINVDKFVEDNNIVIQNENVRDCVKENNVNREIIYYGNKNNSNDVILEKLIENKETNTTKEKSIVENIRNSEIKNNTSISEKVYDLLTLKDCPKIKLHDSNESSSNETTTDRENNEKCVAKIEEINLLEKSNYNNRSYEENKEDSIRRLNEKKYNKNESSLLKDNRIKLDNNEKKLFNSSYNDCISNHSKSVFTEPFEKTYETRFTIDKDIIDTNFLDDNGIKSHYRDVSYGDLGKNDLCDIMKLVKESNESKGANKSYECAELYKDFCDHFEELKSRQKYAIKPDFLRNERTDDKNMIRSIESQDNSPMKKLLIEEINEDNMQT